MLINILRFFFFLSFHGGQNSRTRVFSLTLVLKEVVEIDPLLDLFSFLVGVGCLREMNVKKRNFVGKLA
jgi:hypothetical protein